MNDNDAMQMMQRCSEEIRSLRRTIKNLAPEADAYESLRIVLWRLDKAIAIKEAQNAKQTVAEEQPE